MTTKKLEIAAFNLASALAAQTGGADRIELCINQHLGGTSPSWEMVAEAKAKIELPIRVMIRPRGGDFVYNEAEFEQMKAEIIAFKALKIEGFVFGMLTEEKKIDVTRCKELVALAAPLPCTFHRAFDECENPEIALEAIIGCGFSHLLTSGTKHTALEGANLLQQLVQQAQNRLTILVGGGVRSSNLTQLISETQAMEYHSSALIQGEIADVEEVRKMRELLGQLL